MKRERLEWVPGKIGLHAVDDDGPVIKPGSQGQMWERLIIDEVLNLMKNGDERSMRGQYVRHTRPRYHDSQYNGSDLIGKTLEVSGVTNHNMRFTIVVRVGAQESRR